MGGTTDGITLQDLESDPSRYIHVIRGHQVILDHDLARLYGVETKVFNQSVKRNITRFPDRFRFQLTPNEFESLRSQIVTSSHGGRRYLPYAFTEPGIAMLSAVLRSETAIKVSISIMDAFVEMRKLVANNAAFLEHIATIEFRQQKYQQSTDERFDKVFGYFESHALPAQKVFFKGEMFDAFALLVDLVKTAEKNVTVIDGYVDERTLNILAKKGDGVSCRLVTYPSAPLSTSDLRVFESQYGPVEICRTNDFHDRFLIIDDTTIYHIGASLKDAGKKTFGMTLLNDAALEDALLSKLRDRFVAAE